MNRGEIIDSELESVNVRLKEARVESHPDAVSEMLLLKAGLETIGYRWQDALRTCEECICVLEGADAELSSRLRGVRHQQAVVLTLLGESERAAAVFEQVDEDTSAVLDVAFTPAFMFEQYEAGSAAYEAGDLDNAVGILVTVLEPFQLDDPPENFVNLTLCCASLLASAEYAGGDLVAASIQLSELVRRFSHVGDSGDQAIVAGAYVNLAAILSAQGQTEQALSVASAAVSYTADHAGPPLDIVRASAQLEHGRLAEQAGGPAAALASYRTLIQEFGGSESADVQEMLKSAQDAVERHRKT